MSDLSSEPPSTALHLAGRSFLYGAAGIAAKAAALITVPYLARQLGPAEYGLADLATSTAAILGIVVSFSGDLAAARLVGQERTPARRDAVFRMYVVATALVSIVISGLLVPLSPAIAGELWSSAGDAYLAVFALALVPISAIQAALANLPRLAGKGRLHAGLALIDLLAQLAFAVIFVAVGLGAAGVVAGFVAGSIIGLISAGYAARNGLWGALDWALGRRVLLGGLPYLPALVLPLVADLISRVVLATDLSTAEVGLFGVAIRVASAMSLLAGAFTAAYGPELLAREYSDSSMRSFARVFRAFVVVLGATAAILTVWAPEVIVVVAGSSYAGAAQILPALAGAGVATGGYAVLMLAAGLGDRSNAVAWTSTAGATVQIILVTQLVAPIGPAGAGLAALFGQLVAVGLLHRAISKRVSGVGSVVAGLFVVSIAVSAAPLAGIVGATLAVKAAVTLAVVAGSLFGLRAVASALMRHSRSVRVG